MAIGVTRMCSTDAQGLSPSWVPGPTYVVLTGAYVVEAGHGEELLENSEQWCVWGGG